MDYFEKQAATRNLVKLAMAIRATQRMQKQGGIWDNVKGAWGSVSDAARRGWNTATMQGRKLYNGRAPWATDYRPEGAHTDHLTDEEWRLMQTVPPEVQQAYSDMVKRRYTEDKNSFALNSQAAERLLNRGRQLYGQQKAWEASKGEPGRVPEAFGMQKDYDRMMRQAETAYRAFRTLPTIADNNRIALNDEINKIHSREVGPVHKAIAETMAGIASDNSYNKYLHSIRRSLPSYLQSEGDRSRNSSSVTGGEPSGLKSTGYSIFNPATWGTRSGSHLLLPLSYGFKGSGPYAVTDMLGHNHVTPKGMLRNSMLSARQAKDEAIEADGGERYAVDPTTGVPIDSAPLRNTNRSKAGWSLDTHGAVSKPIVKPKLTWLQWLGFGDNADRPYKINPILTRDNYQDHVRRVGVNNLSSNDLSLVNGFQTQKGPSPYTNGPALTTNTPKPSSQRLGG